ncbi:T9SS type A sorting domain-containing protein [Hymenobacter sp. BRD128]|uniref:M43 family zinc metalloprotease n=1 Tax=Hymenobacter sp. BRD128 TaxID=2675878 RepID=UPI0015644891|nr:M43 family zinc metalloprotease [Hymenobacter sp. BRD128]QKG57178.1 T9SS type A sorting domain-containing protein [Hymenobacter sp. BRD128]
MVKCATLLLSLWLLTFGALPGAGQTPTHVGPRTCGTPQADAWQQAQLARRRPGYRAAKLGATAPRPRRTTAATTYTLPVVVHIIHNGEAAGTGANISQAQVQSQFDVLNEDYRNLNADGALVPAAFQPVRADAQVQFVPALRDPGGRLLPEPGIDRVDRNTLGLPAPPYDLSTVENTVKPATDWNPDQYLNIWVLDLGTTLLGFAQFPDNTAGLAGLSPSGGDANTDGVVIAYAAFGRVGTLYPNYNKGRTLTHELGHWLGLIHVWGDSNCGDDYCADTPTQETSNTGCRTFPHVTCSNAPTGDMFMNFLDYSDDACLQLFTNDQKGRMQDVMAAGTPRRAILLTSPALCNGTPLAATAAVAGGGTVCPGSSVTLTASGPVGASYAWTGPNGYASAQQNPVLPAVAAAQAGTYTVRVAVTTGLCPASASTTLTVSPAPPTPVLAASAATFCPSAGASVALTATNLPAGGIYTWSLVSGDGLPAGTSGTTISVTPTQSSTYRLTVALPGGGCTSAATVSVQVLQPVWSGAAGNGNWFDAANWSGCVPSRATDALIPAGLATPYPVITSGTAEVRTLTQLGPLALGGGELDLYGDHLGTGTFTHSGGTLATRGAGAQRLRPGEYQTLLIGGTGTKTIGAASIAQALTLGGAVLSTGSATLTLAPAATITETDASYVLGQVQTTRPAGPGAEAFGGLGLLIVPLGAAGATTVVRTTGQPQGVGAASSISRYFDIQTAVGPGATLAQQYLPHELNGLAENQLTMFHSTDAGATWSNEGATQRDAFAHAVRRAYVTTLNGRWTLASAASPPTLATITYAINAFPVPFGTDGLSIQVTTATAGPLNVQLYDLLGRVIYSQDLAAVEVGTSTVALPGSGLLAPAKYVLVVRQSSQTAKLNVVRQ